MFIDLIIITIVLFFLAGTGRWLLRRFSNEQPTVGVEFNLALLAGLLLLAFVMLLLGALGWLQPVGTAGVVLLFALFGLRNGWQYFKVFLSSVKLSYQRFSFGQLRSFTSIILCLTAVLILVVLIGALGPPVGWDALNYHLAVPDLYRISERIILTPSILHSHYPQLVHMVYLFFLLLGRESLPAVLNVLLGGLFLASFYRYLRHNLGDDSAWLGLGVMASIPLFWFVLPGGHIEPAALWALWWLWWAYLERTKFARLSKVVAVAGAVFLIGSKYSHWIFVAVLAGVWLWSERRNWQRQGVKILALVCVISALSAPWLAKNWIQTGNPIYPYQVTTSGLSTSEPNPNMTIIAGEPDSITDAAWWEKRPISLLSLPVVMTFLPRSMGGDSPKVGPLLFSLLPLAVWFGWRHLRRRQPDDRWSSLHLNALGLFVLTAGVAWALVLRLTRYYFPLFPLLVLLLVVAWYAFDRELHGWQKKFWRLGWFSVVVVALLYNLAVAVKTNSRAMPVVFGLVSRENYLSQAVEPLHPEQKLVPEYEIYQRANALLDERDRILLIGELRGYYLEIPYLWGRPDLARTVRYDRIDSRPAALRELQSLGVTHLIFHQDLLKPGTVRNPDATVRAYEPGLAIIAEEVIPEDCLWLALEDPYVLCAL